MQNCYDPSTASKQSKRFPENYPKNIVKGKGAYVWDEEGKKYLDFMCALGPIILGYRYPKVDESVQKAIKDFGTIFSLSHPLERKLAQKLCEIFDTEVARFGHNGVDVTTAAIRLARHITGNELILSFSYHGCSDVFMACTKADKGVPQCLKFTITDFDYNDEKRIYELFKKERIAAVIMEPHTIRQPNEGYLRFIRDICDRNDALLIFDEIVTFPRYIKFSAQKTYGITPDLTCVSKGMANGYPISAILGKEKHMKHFSDNNCFFSTTFGGNLIGVSAALATLEEVISQNVPRYLDYLGKTFRRALIKDITDGINPRQFFKCSDDDRQKIMQEMIEQEVFFGIPIFFNYSMTDKEMLATAEKLNKVLERLPKIEIKGRKLTEVFKKR